MGRAESAALPALATANQEPGEPTLRRVVQILNLPFEPLTRREWFDQDKIPQTGGAVFVANHISNVDPLVIGQYLAFSGRWPRFLAKSSLFGVPVMGRVITACSQIPVERNSRNAAKALEAAIEVVAAGKSVVVYPEGTITFDPDLWPMAGKTGAARIALATGCPVIPIGQWGAHEIMWGRKVHFPKFLPRKTLKVKAGDPVDLDDLRDVPLSPATLRTATDRIMAAITALVADVRGERPPAHLGPQVQPDPGGPL